MIDRNSVLEIIKAKGLVIPRDIMKELGGDTFLIGAVLSQLKDSKQIKVSYTKIGGSPVYYYPGQESRLQDLFKYLNPKEKEAYNLIRQGGILQDSTLEPAIRVALREIKDFAKPVEVTLKDQKILFWKWYLLPNNFVESKIRESLSKQQPQKTETEIPEKKPKDIEKKAIQREEKTDKVGKKQEQKKEEKPTQDDFLSTINDYFQEKNIEIIEKELIKKNKEFDFIIRVPSAAGKLNFYCKAKNKKRINEGDLSSAFVKAETKKLPILYLTTGKLTKKAKDMLNEEFKNITVNNI
ncbi:hypothetical protein JXB41_01475 [Candidatus Woesearchaeota archaeon]|nr:hypothetical protein [Candidatus Woesearchaeota archaeon]